MIRNGIITLGALVAVLPFLGIPGSFKEPLYVLLGIGVAASGYYLSSQGKRVFSSARPVKRARRETISGETSVVVNGAKRLQIPVEPIRTTDEEPSKNS